MITRVALEGIDGAGKTSAAEAMVLQLTSEGLSAAVFAPYRAANEMLGVDIYNLWKNEPDAIVAIDALHDVMRQRELRATEEGTDVLIYDRQWMTAFTEIGGRLELERHWRYFVPAAHLGVSPAVAQRRLCNDKETSWSTLDQQYDYALKYGRLAINPVMRKHMLGLYRSDSDVTPEALARNIIWDMNIQR